MRRRTATAVASLALALGACGGGGDPSAPSAHSPAPTATVAAPPATPTALRVRFRASDGRPLKGVYRPAGAAAPAVVLVNGLVGGADQWDEFTAYLHDAGFASLAYDGRGGVDEAELVKDVNGAVAFLRARRDVDPRRLGIVGSSVGASTALLAVTGPDRRRLRAAVVLSPPAAPVFDALIGKHRYHPRNVLFMSDYREQSTVKALVPGAIDSRTVVSEMAGHGLSLIETEPQRRVALDWLEEHVTPVAGRD